MTATSPTEETTLPVLRPPGFATSPKTPKLFLATPMYGAMAVNSYVVGVSALAAELPKRGIEVEMWMPGNESLITRARNKAVAEFLLTDCTHLLFIDADVGFRPNDVAALLVAEEDVVCGAYPMKKINWRAVEHAVKAGDPHESLYRASASYPVNLFPEALASGEIRAIKRNGRTYVEVQDAATGFLLITRSIIERLIKEFGSWLEYTTDYEPHMATHYALFDAGSDPMSPREAAKLLLCHAAATGTAEQVQAAAIKYACAMEQKAGRYLSEDYFFSRLVQMLGERIWLCMDIELTHTGTYIFRGNLDKIIPFRGGTREGAKR